MDLTQGALMKMFPEKWGEIEQMITEAKKSGKKEVLVHKQELPLDNCHLELRNKINNWLQNKNKELYAKIYDDKFQGCFIATNPEVFVAWQ